MGADEGPTGEDAINAAKTVGKGAVDMITNAPGDVVSALSKTPEEAQAALEQSATARITPDYGSMTEHKKQK